MRLGFDEVYVILHDNDLWAECLYDARTADEEANKIRAYSPEKVTRIPLEQYINQLQEKINKSNEYKSNMERFTDILNPKTGKPPF